MSMFTTMMSDMSSRFPLNKFQSKKSDSLLSDCGRNDWLTSSSRDNHESVSIALAYGIFVLSLVVVLRQFTDHDFSAVLTLGAGIQCLGFVCLSLKIRQQGSVAGISMKMLQMYVIMLLFRLTSTLNKNGYLPVDRSGDWVYQAADIVTLALVCQLLYRISTTHKSTYDVDHDTMKILPMIPPCIFLAIIIHADLNNSPFYDTVWTIGMNLDTVAMLPQLWMLTKKGGEVEMLTAHFVAAIVISRLCAFSFWFYGYPELAPRDGGFNWAGWKVVGAHAAQIALSGDFMYYYIQSMLNAKRMLLPTFHV